MSAYDQASILINRCKRILALVDTYAERQTADTRTDLRKALMEEFEAPAIAPPVAAGSVDTPEFRQLMNSWSGAQIGPGLIRAYQSVIAHIIAWGAQQREEGFQEGVAQLQYERDNLQVLAIQRRERAEKAEESLKLWREEAKNAKSWASGQLARAERAEAELAQVNQWCRTAHQINEDLAARILKADGRIDDLEAEIEVLLHG